MDLHHVISFGTKSEQLFLKYFAIPLQSALRPHAAHRPWVGHPWSNHTNTKHSFYILQK